MKHALKKQMFSRWKNVMLIVAYTLSQKQNKGIFVADCRNI